jgi:predicted metal-dependent phosphoesterase TrpH
MLLKANLHFHTGDDPNDYVAYSTKEGIDWAAALGFKVLALTCHNKVALTPEYAVYADERGITLLSGIECGIGETAGEGRHVVLLNCDRDAESIRTFRDLEQYKKEHLDVFVLAPHPYYPHLGSTISLMEYTDRYAHLFDAVEHSWFYSKHFNKNKPAIEAAKRHSLPIVATSDTHFMDFLDTDYCIVEADTRTPNAIFDSLRAGSFRNVTRPKRFVSELVIPFGMHEFKNYVLYPRFLR